ALHRARIRHLTLTADDHTPAEQRPGTQLSGGHPREKRLRLQPVTGRLNQQYGHRAAGPAGTYTTAS
ncbi:hypothetical protein, partial [Streptomyces sp. NPDC047981]|uniref:hypothetical protein n=1 Tax=Streptomyces sp. NPDC047981 TaxID=3154610 RepID=UPI00343E1E4C